MSTKDRIIVKDFLQKLLNKNPEKRLGGGSEGIFEIFCHTFFYSINFENLDLQTPPYVPCNDIINAKTQKLIGNISDDDSGGDDDDDNNNDCDDGDFEGNEQIPSKQGNFIKYYGKRSNQSCTSVGKHMPHFSPFTSMRPIKIEQKSTNNNPKKNVFKNIATNSRLDYEAEIVEYLMHKQIKVRIPHNIINYFSSNSNYIYTIYDCYIYLSRIIYRNRMIYIILGIVLIIVV